MIRNDFYANSSARMDTAIGGNIRPLLRLKQAFVEYQNHQSISFSNYVLEHYGVLIEYDDDQNIKPNYSVVDEQKYTVFLLKFS